MKTVNIILPNKNYDNNGSIKNKILNEVNKRYPFFKWNMNDNEPEFSVEYAGPRDTLVFDFINSRFSALNKRFWNPYPNEEIKHYANTLVAQSNRTYDAETDLDMAMYRLKKYAEFINSYNEDRGYDFVYMGMPCRIYDKFIQIGSNIIPYDGYSTFIHNIRNIEKQKKLIATITKVSKTLSIELAA